MGTRGSALARWQAEWTAGRLREKGHVVEIVLIRTQGDAQQSGPIAAIGAQGVFTKELQAALLEGRIDLAVHSMKDLPTTRIEGLVMGAVPPRQGVRDALVSPRFATLDQLPDGSIVGTGSSRRRAQLLAYRPDLEVRDLRGNVDTRLRKVDEGQYDAILLAEAGLRRLGLEARIAALLPMEVMLPAPAQGALAIECRADDPATLAALASLDHPATRAAVTAERAALRRLEGGCLAAMGGYAQPSGAGLILSAVVLSEDGKRSVRAEAEDTVNRANELGQTVAESLLAQGAAALLRER